jgi:hypothetical protein
MSDPQFSIADVLAHVSKAAHEVNPQLRQGAIFQADVDVLGLTLDAEGRSQSLEGRAAIAWTVANRRAGLGPRIDTNRSYADVCLRRLQYSCWFEVGGGPNYTRTLRMAEAIVGGKGKLLDVPATAWKRLTESRWLAQGVVQGTVLDPTGGCAHYMTRELYHRAPPSWAKGVAPAVTIGDHVFFKGIK